MKFHGISAKNKYKQSGINWKYIINFFRFWQRIDKKDNHVQAVRTLTSRNIISHRKDIKKKIKKAERTN